MYMEELEGAKSLLCFSNFLFYLCCINLLVRNFFSGKKIGGAPLPLNPPLRYVCIFNELIIKNNPVIKK